MNEHLRQPRSPAHFGRPRPGTTRVADGIYRRAWTADEVQRMAEAGIHDAGERVELVGGDLVAMSPKGILHEALKIALNAHWMSARPDYIMIAPESPLRLGPYDEPEPDFFVFPAAIPASDVRGDSVPLVVEITDTSLEADRTVKAARYAAHGVREVWVVNARTRVTTVLREPSEAGYGLTSEVPGAEPLVPLLVPELAVRMNDLK